MGLGITLEQLATSVPISFSGIGIAYTSTSATGSTHTIVRFTSQNKVPGTITQILAAVSSAYGFTNSVLATYDSTSAVPEPMILSMMGIGLLGLGLLRGRRKKRLSFHPPSVKGSFNGLAESGAHFLLPQVLIQSGSCFDCM